MVAAYLVVTLLTVLANGYAAAGDFLHTEQTVANAARVGAPRTWLLPLGALKTAGAVGLLMGIAVPALGVAAAIGLVLFFVCAVAAHIRVRWFVTIPVPAAFLLLAAGSLVLRLATM
ncbi:DoxX family protein [Rhodococcus sp. D2-41]|uniref:DoxX family protein n=1 Tax=Speluncibacter jeojiensis TaxID=2710754 RepID=A0A9X4M288_9ACTN|nr:DoxX family protein [Rhodococcus sp. D2-41]MDG3011298.1 DoxX family protein [Rhodococcus sp. D2-41]MDG3015851.1 DoxX family protein [Corynebacteriales bacterium D3-21]